SERPCRWRAGHSGDPRRRPRRYRRCRPGIRSGRRTRAWAAFSHAVAAKRAASRASGRPMMRVVLAAHLLLVPALALAGAPASECPATPAFRQAVERASQDDAARDGRDALVPKLAACLGHPDPSLRDGLAYAQLAAWLRAD